MFTGNSLNFTGKFRPIVCIFPAPLYASNYEAIFRPNVMRPWLHRFLISWAISVYHNHKRCEKHTDNTCGKEKRQWYQSYKTKKDKKTNKQTNKQTTKQTNKQTSKQNPTQVDKRTHPDIAEDSLKKTSDLRDIKTIMSGYMY